MKESCFAIIREQPSSYILWSIEPDLLILTPLFLVLFHCFVLELYYQLCLKKLSCRNAPLSSCRRKRGTVKGSVTRIRNCLKDLSKQDTGTSPSEVISHAKLLLNKLETLEADFEKCHSASIDLIEEPRILDQEHKALDEHDDEVAALTVALQQLVAAHFHQLRVDFVRPLLVHSTVSVLAYLPSRAR